MKNFINIVGIGFGVLIIFIGLIYCGNFSSYQVLRGLGE
jgi:hypothetical protein